MKLNRTGSNWTELERNKINENWRIIESNYNDVVDKVSEEAFDKVVNSAKLNWKEPVDKYADLPSGASEGDTRMVRDSGRVYRFNGEVWQEIQQIDAGPVNELDARLTTQLAQTEQQMKQKRDAENTGNVEPFYIETFDGSNEPYHPSVQYFDTPWNGYKYWMAYTPFPFRNVPPYKDRWECPSIVVSKEGTDWRLPYGAPNPLVDLTPEEIERGDYFSDPDIVMSGDTMEVWYRKTNGANTAETDIYRITSTDGVNWTSPERVLEALNPNNGFPGNQTMRSHQVFYDGTEYEVFFSVQGSYQGHVAYTKTSNPSSGIWEAPTTINFINAPSGMWTWHLGVYKEGNTYHMVCYDPENNALQYFISTNKTDFEFVDTILKADISFTDLGRLYQSVPLKVGDNWLLYVGGTFRTSFSTEKNGIALFVGKDLTNLVYKESRQKYFERFPSLTNVYEEGKVASNYYGTYSSFEKNVFNGYAMKFGKEGQGRVHNAPYWKRNSDNYPIVHVVEGEIELSHPPQHAGIILKHYKDDRLFISLDDKKVSDWKEIKFVESVRMDAASQAVIMVKGVHRLVIQTEGDTTTITNLTGNDDGQELFVLNTLSKPITLKNNAGGYGNMRLHGGVDKVLNRYDGVALIAFGNVWYEK